MAIRYWFKHLERPSYGWMHERTRKMTREDAVLYAQIALDQVFKERGNYEPYSLVLGTWYAKNSRFRNTVEQRFAAYMEAKKQEQLSLLPVFS